MWSYIIGAIVVIMAYLFLLYRSIVIAKKCDAMFPALLVIGLTFSLVFQALINMAVAVNLFPVTGQTLPLLSMGGSSILFTSFALGIILSISRTFSKPQKIMDEPNIPANEGDEYGEDEEIPLEDVVPRGVV